MPWGSGAGKNFLAGGGRVIVKIKNEMGNKEWMGFER